MSIDASPNRSLKISAQYDLIVPFFDVDSMNIVWHGNYCKYMELARCKLLDKIGYNYKAMAASGFAFPVVDLSIKYIKPLLFEQPVTIIATLEEWQYRLKISYRFTDTASGERLTKAHTVQATVDKSNGKLCLTCPSVLIESVQSQLLL